MSDTGYTRLSNDLFDWLLAKSSVLSKRELIVMLVVVRNTTGWNRTDSPLSCRYIATATGLDASNVNKAIHELAEKELIIVDRTTRTAVIRINQQAVVKTTTPETTVVESTTVKPDSGQINHTHVVKSTTPPWSNQPLNSGQIDHKQRQETQKQNNNNPKLAEWLQ